MFLVTVFIFVRFLIRTRTDNCSNHSVSQRELVLYGLPFVPMLLMEWLLQWMDKWSIRTFQDFAETGIYASASQIMTVLLTFKISYVAFWSPVAMEKYENCSEKECKDFFADMFDKVQFLGMCAAFLLTIFRDVIVLILGKNYRDAVLIIPFLSLMPIMSTLFEMTGQGVKFVGKTKYFYYSSGAAIICNFVGNNVLVPRFAGAGAALATAITYIVYFAIGTYFSNKCYPVKYKFGKFSIAIVIYFLYSIYATFMDKGIICSLIGCVLLALICLINYSTLKGLLQIFKSMAAVYIGKIKGLVKK